LTSPPRIAIGTIGLMPSGWPMAIATLKKQEAKVGGGPSAF